MAWHIYIFIFIAWIVQLDLAFGKLPPFLCNPSSRSLRTTLIHGALKGVRTFVEDPMPIPNRQGRIPLTDGQLRGLSTLKLRGDPIVFCDDDQLSANIIAELGTDFLAAVYKWEYKLTWLISMSGAVNLRADDFVVYAKVLYKKTDRKTSMEVKKLEVKTLSNFRIDYSGSGSWFLTRLSNVLIPFFRSTLKGLMETSIKQHLNEELRKRML